MKNIKNIGLDVGNFDTKTQNTTIPSGFIETDTIPFGVDSYLEYENKIYTLSEDARFSYTKDKTENDRCFILSLIAIAEELIYCAKDAVYEDSRMGRTARSIQQEINTVSAINLAVGLPPTHMKLSDKLINYYTLRFGDQIAYKYAGYEFVYSLNAIRCYPQDFAALVTYKPHDKENSVVSYPSYYGIDIGGWTVDVVSITNKKINPAQNDSKELGVLAMYDTIIRDIEIEYGIRYTIVDIESMLKGEKTLMPEDVKVAIKEHVKKWYDKIIQSMPQSGVDLKKYPVVFLGGGALLFKDYIISDAGKRLVKAEIITEPNANAKAYARIINKELK